MTVNDLRVILAPLDGTMNLRTFTLTDVPGQPPGAHRVLACGPDTDGAWIPVMRDNDTDFTGGTVLFHKTTP